MQKYISARLAISFGSFCNVVYPHAFWYFAFSCLCILPDRNNVVPQNARWHWDSKKDERRCLHASAQAVAHALEATMRCADDCVSLHGGMGFIRDALAEKYMRDAKQIALCCPTVDQLDQLAAAIDLGGHLDAALLLPTPETQAIFT